VDVVLGWTSISETARRKLLWDNAVQCYRRYGTRALASSIPLPQSGQRVAVRAEGRSPEARAE